MCDFGKIREEINLIEVEHLVKKYGSLTAVDNLSMKIEPGHILWLAWKEWCRQDNDNEYGHRLYRCDIRQCQSVWA